MFAVKYDRTVYLSRLRSWIQNENKPCLTSFERKHTEQRNWKRSNVTLRKNLIVQVQDGKKHLWRNFPTQNSSMFTSMSEFNSGIRFFVYFLIQCRLRGLSNMIARYSSDVLQNHEEQGRRETDNYRSPSLFWLRSKATSITCYKHKLYWEHHLKRRHLEEQ